MQGGSAAEMVSAKRFHQQYLPDSVNYEAGAFTASELSELSALGHRLSESKRPFGNMNVVIWDYQSGTTEAASDPRGDGEGRVY